MEVVLATVDDTGAESAARDLPDLTSTSGVLVSDGGGVLLLKWLLSESEEETALVRFVGIDGGHAIVALVVGVVHAESAKEPGDVRDQLDGLLPGADVGVDLVEEVSDALGGVLQTALAVLAISLVSAVVVVVAVPRAVPGSGEGTLVTGVLAAMLNGWLDGVSGR